MARVSYCLNRLAIPQYQECALGSAGGVVAATGISEVELVEVNA